MQALSLVGFTLEPERWPLAWRQCALGLWVGGATAGVLALLSSSRGHQVNPQLSRVISGLPLPHHCWWCFPQVSGGSRVSVSETPTSLCSD